jgi:hypothetical protein
MITPLAGTRVWLAVCVTDMRKDFGFAMLVQENLQHDHICSKRCGGTARACACLRSGWRGSLRLALAG